MDDLKDADDDPAAEPGRTKKRLRPNLQQKSRIPTNQSNAPEKPNRTKAKRKCSMPTSLISNKSKSVGIIRFGSAKRTILAAANI